MRYTYDRNRYLMLVVQKVSSKKFSVQWDRTSYIRGKIEKLEALLTAQLPSDQVAAILSTMLSDFLKLSSRLQLVA